MRVEWTSRLAKHKKVVFGGQGLWGFEGEGGVGRNWSSSLSIPKLRDYTVLINSVVHRRM